MSSREGKGAPALVRSGIASAAASETAPRIPVQPITAASPNGADGSRARKLGKNAGEYPKGPIANSLKQLAQLIKAEVGLRVGCADAGGWDTHAGQPGQLSNNLKQLGESLSAFRRDLGKYADDVDGVLEDEEEELEDELEEDEEYEYEFEEEDDE